MKVQILRGFRDYMPAEMMAKARMLDTVTRVFESFGYPPIQTPALEYTEVLRGKAGEESDTLMYRFLDNGQRDVGLRYDLTVPLARFVAEHGNLPMPFRRYQVAPVWRAEKPAKGRYREFMQCDVDLVGVNDASADAEMILIGTAAMRALGVEGFTIRTNHRGVLRGLTRTLGVTDGPQEAAFLRLLDKLPKIGEEKYRVAVREQFALDDEALERLFVYVTASGSSAEILSSIERIVGRDPDGAEGLKRLRAVLELTTAGGAEGKVVVDPSIARGLSYYTGLIYETILDELPGIGSVMSGGRYDDLVGVFSKRDLPSVGISLGVDRLIAALDELTSPERRETPAQVLVVRFDEDGAADSLGVAAQFRDAGISTVVYPTSSKLRKQFQFADTMGVPWTAIIGKDEAAAGEVTLKNMASGDQQRTTVALAIERVAEALTQ